MQIEQTKKYLVKVGNDYNSSFLFETDEVEDCKESMLAYINKNIKKHYYSRIFDFGNYILIDYGSWSDFIYIYFLDSSVKCIYLKEVFKIGD